VTSLEALRDVKALGDGTRVTFRARVLRSWDVGGLRMALVGDETALVRVELGDAWLAEGRSYEIANALVKTYPGGWHSVALDGGSSVTELAEDVRLSQSDEYIERTYKILAGIQRKKGRATGRLPPWRHPADSG
jgi:hypothetical protein